MKALLAFPLFVFVLNSCTQSGYQIASNRVQEQMHVVDKTDYAKINQKLKIKVEGQRSEQLHKYADDTDKKLNHQKNEQINKKKGWDGGFGFY